MKTKLTVKVFAFAILMPMLIMAFAVAPAQAKSSGSEYKLVDNIKMDKVTIDLYQVPLTDVQKAMLNEIVPLDLLLGSGIQYVYIDGMAHINLMVKEKCDKLLIDLHIRWHGTIALLDHDKNVVMALKSKCLQIEAHAKIQMIGDQYQADLWLNIHANSMCCGRCHSNPENLKLHVILSFSDGELDMIKASLPQFADAAIC
ncbi:MAG: hypothetical protein ABR986_11495 [Methanomassiliicoccales archaeon]|jgi:hypothetical protein